MGSGTVCDGVGATRLELRLLGVARSLIAGKAVKSRAAITYFPIGVKVNRLEAFRRDARIELGHWAVVHGEGRGWAIDRMIVLRRILLIVLTRNIASVYHACAPKLVGVLHEIARVCGRWGGRGRQAFHVFGVPIHQTFFIESIAMR